MRKLTGLSILIAILTSISIAHAQPFDPKAIKDPFAEQRKKEFQKIINESKKNRPKLFTTPQDPNCINGKTPELILENLKLNGVNESTDFTSLVYNFSLDIKNFHPQGPIGPVNATLGISLSVFDGTKLQQDGMTNNVTYGDLLSDYKITTIALLSDDGKGVKIECNASVNFKNINVSLPKDAETNDLIFMVDSLNKIQEKNDAPNQKGNTNASLKDNNIANYQIVQPFKSFQLTASNYDKQTKALDFGSSFNFMNSNGENDLKKLGYGFSTEVWEIDNNSPFGTLESIGSNEAFNIQFLGGFIKNEPPKIFSILDAAGMATNGAPWTTNKNLKMEAGAKYFAVLVMTAPGGAKYPLYAITAIGPKTEEEAKINYQNCDYDAGKCKYLIFTRTSEETVEADLASISEANPQTASTFKGCNYADTPATIQSLKFKVYTGAEQVGGGIKIINTFLIDGKNIWNEVPYQNWGDDSAHEDSEIVLQDPVIINPGECSNIEVQTTSADKGYKYEFFSLKNAKTDVESYFYHPYQKQLRKFEENYYEDLPGTDVVFKSEEGAFVWFSTYPDGKKYSYKNGNPVEIADFEISTNPNATFKINKLDFSVESSYQGDLNAQIVLQAPRNYFDVPKTPEVQKITIPANGEFSIDVDGFTFDYFQRADVYLDMIGPFESEGKITVKLKNVGPSMDNLILTNLFSDIAYNKKWITPKELPLGNTIYLVEPKEVEAVTFDISPNTWWGMQRWFSETKLGKENLWTINLSGKYTGSSPISVEPPPSAGPGDTPGTEPPVETKESLKTISLSDLNLVFDGNFSQFDLDFNFKFPQEDKNYKVTKTVFPGDTVTLDLPDLTIKSQWMDITINPINYPALELFDLNNLEITPQPVTATYFDDTKIPVLIQEAKQNDQGVIQYSPAEFINPYTDADQYWFGKELLYLVSDWNSPIAQTKKIGLLQPNEEITMNNVCFSAIGDIQIEKIIYQHDAHDVQPFDKVVLNHANGNIYLPLAGWTLNEAAFSPTPPDFIGHNGGNCFILKVQGPKEPLNGTYFNLAEINAVINGTEIKVPVIGNKNTKEELSSTNPIKGTVINFK